MLLLCLHAAAFVRFEVESAEVSEDERTIALCINVTGFSEEISYHFTLQINDIPDTAGKIVVNSTLLNYWSVKEIDIPLKF